MNTIYFGFIDRHASTAPAKSSCRSSRKIPRCRAMDRICAADRRSQEPLISTRRRGGCGRPGRRWQSPGIVLSLAWIGARLANSPLEHVRRHRLCCVGHFPPRAIGVRPAVRDRWRSSSAGLVVFPVLVLIAATAAALGPWVGLSQRLRRRAPEFVASVHDWPLSGTPAAAISSGQARIARSEPHRRQGSCAVALIRMVPIAPFSLVNVLAGASQLTAGRLSDRHRPWHGAGHHHDGGARRADRGFCPKRIVVECPAARPHHRGLGRRLPRGTVRRHLVAGRNR